MAKNTQLESHHGILMRISGCGVLILGPAGIGKSSLALELISHGHQLISDDIVELYKQDNTILGRCPPMLEGLLHTRELGLISIPKIFGHSAWTKEHKVDVVVSLHTFSENEVSLSTPKKIYTLFDHSFPHLILSTHNPASLATRIQCWLKIIVEQHQTEHELMQRQHASMSTIKYRELS